MVDCWNFNWETSMLCVATIPATNRKMRIPQTMTWTSEMPVNFRGGAMKDRSSPVGFSKMVFPLDSVDLFLLFNPTLRQGKQIVDDPHRSFF
jgi:hypothetical protein